MPRRTEARTTLLSIALAAAACGGVTSPLEGTEATSGALTGNTKDGCFVTGDRTALSMRDDDSRAVDLPFAFPFHGRTYTRLYANANGNVTFDRSFTGFTPRLDGSRAMVAVLLGDLDPGRLDGAGGDSDVSVTFAGAAPERVVAITWNRIPEYGSNDPNTFQTVLSENGSITLTYRLLSSDGTTWGGAPMVAGESGEDGRFTVVASGTELIALAGSSRTLEPMPDGSFVARTGCFSARPPAIVNALPVADAGPDVVVECTGPDGATVTLDGTASADPDGDALAFRWESGGAALGEEAVVNATLPVGSHEVALAVDDGRGGSASDTVSVTVTDDTAPAIRAASHVRELWPPNGKLVRAVSGLAASDACCDAVLDVTVSGDPADSRVERRDDGSFDVFVRARRQGTERDGRTYSIVVSATDCHGRRSSETFTVHVPHDQR